MGVQQWGARWQNRRRSPARGCRSRSRGVCTPRSDSKHISAFASRPRDGRAHHRRRSARSVPVSRRRSGAADAACGAGARGRKGPPALSTTSRARPRVRELRERVVVVGAPVEHLRHEVALIRVGRNDSLAVRTRYVLVSKRAPAPAISPRWWMPLGLSAGTSLRKRLSGVPRWDTPREISFGRDSEPTPSAV